MTFFIFLAAATMTWVVATDLGHVATIGIDGLVIMMMVMITVGAMNVLSGLSMRRSHHRFFRHRNLPSRGMNGCPAWSETGRRRILLCSTLLMGGAALCRAAFVAPPAALSRASRVDLSEK
jgi:hypothetical protein